MRPVGIALKNIRERRNISQRELAKRSGVPRTTISKLESGKINSIKFEIVAFELSKGFDLEPKAFVCLLIDELLLEDTNTADEVTTSKRILRLKSLGVTLKNLRKKKRLTQAELAQKSGVSRARISQLENHPPSSVNIGTMLNLSSALNMRPEDFLAALMKEDRLL